MHVEICSSSRIELCDLLGLAKGKQYDELVECFPSKNLRNHECFKKASSRSGSLRGDDVGSKVFPNTSLNIANIRKGEKLSSSKLPFLWKLHEMLDDVEKTGDDHIVSWLPHGKAFRVHKPKSFVQKIIPHYFNQSKYKSFQRQLHLYDFVRTPRGIEAGAYRHPKFVRGKKSLCLSLSPHKIKGKIHKKDPAVTGGMSTPIIALSENFNNALPQQQSSLSRKRSRSDSFVDSDDAWESTSKRSNTFTVGSLQCMDSLSDQNTSDTSLKWTSAIRNILVTGASLAADLEACKHISSTDTQTKDNETSAPHNGDVVYAFGGKPFRFIEGELEAKQGASNAALDDAAVCCEGGNDDTTYYAGEDAELLAHATNDTMEELYQEGFTGATWATLV